MEVELMFVVASDEVYIRDGSTLFHYARHRKTKQIYFPGANNCIYTIKIVLPMLLSARKFVLII
jgi:hypothetical protein